MNQKFKVATATEHYLIWKITIKSSFSETANLIELKLCMNNQVSSRDPGESNFNHITANKKLKMVDNHMKQSTRKLN